MRTNSLLLAVLSTALAGCGHTLAPGAGKVLITKKAEDAKDCKVVGPVSFRGTRTDGELKNTTYGMGADTLFLTRHDTSWGTGSSGMTYICRGLDPRQPGPVTEPKNWPATGDELAPLAVDAVSLHLRTRRA